MFKKCICCVAAVLLLRPSLGLADTSPSPTTSENTMAVANDSRMQTPTFSYDELRRFARAFSLVKNQYVEPISDAKLIDAAIDGMLGSLDPHSGYLNKEAMIDLQEDAKGEFGGLGIEIGEKGGYVNIISPLEGTPADKVGILPGDLIVKINGESIKDKSLSEVIKRLRGDPGTDITLTINRASSKNMLEFSMVRELIKVQSVRSKMVEGTAYFRISQFQENTLSDLIAQIKAIKKKPSSIVLDVRNDPGGLLYVAVGVVQLFSDTKETIVSTKARDMVVEEYTRYSPEVLQTMLLVSPLPEWLHTAPMVVLINAGSASASEIVAGALQDDNRATIIGNRSFGKGSVQIVLPIDKDTGIKLTTARYYTPVGRSIQATGIMPDIVVSDTEKGDLFGFPREVDLEDHLENELMKAPPKTQKKVLVDNVEQERMVEFGSDADFQFKQALNFLHHREVNQGVISPSDAVKAVANAQESQAQTVDTPELPSVDPQKTENRALDKALDKALDNKIEKKEIVPITPKQTRPIKELPKELPSGAKTTFSFGIA